MFLKPKPHRFTSGATVMSKAPPVSFDTSCANVNTSTNIALVSVLVLLLMAVMTDSLLKGESDASTSFSALSIPSCKGFADW